MKLVGALMLLVAACGGEGACPAGHHHEDGRCVADDDRADAGDAGDSTDAGDSGRGDPDAAADAGDDAGDAGLDCGARLPIEVWPDEDGDGWGANGPSELACAAAEGQVTHPGDCDDADALVSPDEVEVCNGKDDDCSRGPDTGFECVRGALVTCVTPCGSEATTTCLDACVPGLCPIPEEACNHVDDDCDGLVDDGLQGWLDDPVRLTEDTFDQHLPVVGWTGTDVAVGWSGREIGGAGRTVLEIGTFTQGGVPVQAPLLVAEPAALPVAADLGNLGTLAVFGYALESGPDESQTTVLLRALVDDGGPIPLPIGAGGTMDATSPFEVMPRENGFLVSRLSPQAPPNELRVASWSLDPIGESHVLVGSDASYADIDPTRDGRLLVASVVAGEVLVGRYDHGLVEVDAARAVTSAGGQAQEAQIVTTGDGSLLVYGTLDGLLHALRLEPDLTPGDAVEIGVGRLFPDAVVSTGADTPVGALVDVFVLSVDDASETYRSVRVRATGEIEEGPVDAGSTNERSQMRAAWAGDRWAVVWREYLDDASGDDVLLQSYGCLPQ